MPDSHHHDLKLFNGSVRAVKLGVFVDLCLMSLKLAGGWAFASSSLTADGWHSASDLATDCIALVLVWASQQLRSAQKDSQAAKLLDDSASVVASSALTILGLSMAWENVADLKLRFGLPSSTIDDSYGDEIGSLQSASTPNIHALWIALLTIAVKEWLYCRTLKVATGENSTVLKAAAMHHRVDGLISLVTVASVVLGNFSGTEWTDSVGGLCISLVLTQEGFRNLGSMIWMARKEKHVS